MKRSLSIFVRISSVVLLGSLMVLGTTVQAHGLRDQNGSRAAMLDAAKARLGLSPAQSTQFDAAISASRAAHESVRSQAQPLREQIRTELSTNAPDMRKVAALRDQLQGLRQTAHKQSQNAWLAFYDTLSDAQKQVAREHMRKRLDGEGGFRGEGGLRGKRGL